MRLMHPCIHAATRAGLPSHLPALPCPLVSEQVLGTDQYSLITTIRDPVDRVLSHISFFVFQRLKDVTGRDWTLEQVVRMQAYNNLISCMFGIYNVDDAEAFIASDTFKRVLFVPLNSFDKVVAMLQVGGADGRPLHCFVSTLDQAPPDVHDHL